MHGPNNARNRNMYALLNGDSNQYYAVKDLDGAAGARWTIKTKMQATTAPNGTPDPQFVVTHRIFALNTPSGGLGGFRWFGEIRNPFYATGAKLYRYLSPRPRLPRRAELADGRAGRQRNGQQPAVFPLKTRHVL